MPEKDGYEVIMEICKINPDTKIIAISSGNPEEGMDFLEFAAILGARHTIAKPIKPDELQRAVEQVLSEESPSVSQGA